MTEGTEAAADALTGSVAATAVEGQIGAAAASRAADEAHAACRNCRSALTGNYCAACGQPAHVHRSFASLGHDVLHSVFHFDGKLWRTLPELAIYPGRLTRRLLQAYGGPADGGQPIFPFDNPTPLYTMLNPSFFGRFACA